MSRFLRSQISSVKPSASIARYKSAMFLWFWFTFHPFSTNKRTVCFSFSKFDIGLCRILVPNGISSYNTHEYHDHKVFLERLDSWGYKSFFIFTTCFLWVWRPLAIHINQKSPIGDERFFWCVLSTDYQSITWAIGSIIRKMWSSMILNPAYCSLRMLCLF